MKRSFILLLCTLISSAALAQESDRARLVIETDSGNITLELYDETPLHRDNFLKLAKEGFYDGTTFHRVIENFMIQGGDPNTKEGKEGVLGNGGPGYTIPAEFNPAFVHQKGALCAARKGDNVNPEQESSGSQFYIVQGRTFNDEQLTNFQNQVNNAIRNRITRSFFMAEENLDYLQRVKKAQKESNQDDIMAVMEEVDPIIEARMAEKAFTYTKEQLETYKTIGGTPHLDMQYTVFGQVIDGMDVIDKIASVKKEGERPTSLMRMTVRVLD